MTETPREEMPGEQDCVTTAMAHRTRTSISFPAACQRVGTVRSLMQMLAAEPTGQASSRLLRLPLISNSRKLGAGFHLHLVFNFSLPLLDLFG